VSHCLSVNATCTSSNETMSTHIVSSNLNTTRTNNKDNLKAFGFRDLTLKSPGHRLGTQAHTDPTGLQAKHGFQMGVMKGASAFSSVQNKHGCCLNPVLLNVSRTAITSSRLEMVPSRWASTLIKALLKAP